MEGFHLLPPEKQQEILNGPALRPPENVLPNFDHPHNRNEVAYAVAGVTIAIGTVLVLIRAWSRLVVLKKVRFEDFLILSCYVFSMCHVWVLFLLAKTPGYFVHQWDIRVRDLAPHIWAIHMGVNFYLAAITAGKAAVLLEWLHIFNPHRERNFFLWSCWTVIVANTLFYISAIFVENLHCRPYALIWDKTLEGKCIIMEEYYVVSAAFNLFSDLVCLALPQKVVWSLQLTKKRKMGISLIFMIGILTCVIAAVRVYATTIYITSKDQTYRLSLMSVLTHSEPIGLLTVICVPSIPMVFGRGQFLTKIRSALASWSALLSTRASLSRDRGNSVGLSDTGLSSELHAAYVKMEDVNKSSDSSSGQPIVMITRTTAFTSEETRNSDGDFREEHDRQHPWMRS